MKFYLAICLIVSLAACTTAKKRPAEPQIPSSTGATTEIVGPGGSSESSIRREVPAVTLVLGPGGAKAMAHAGVVKALQENRIPIAKVVGIEWGALVGAAFAAHGQFHEVEWKLYKLDQVDLSGKGGFFGLTRADRTIKILNEYFKQNFDGLDLGSLKIPFSCPTRSFWTGSMVWQRKGAAAEGLKRCLPFPPLFQVQSGWLADSTHSREIVEALKAEGNLVVFVDVLGTTTPFTKEKLQAEPMAALLWQDVQRSIAAAEGIAGEVIRVPTEGIFIDRFDQRKELIQAGEAEGVKAAQRLSSKYGF